MWLCMSSCVKRKQGTGIHSFQVRWTGTLYGRCSNRTGALRRRPLQPPALRPPRAPWHEPSPVHDLYSQAVSVKDAVESVTFSTKTVPSSFLASSPLFGYTRGCSRATLGESYLDDLHDHAMFLRVHYPVEVAPTKAATSAFKFKRCQLAGGGHLKLAATPLETSKWPAVVAPRALARRHTSRKRPPRMLCKSLRPCLFLCPGTGLCP